MMRVNLEIMKNRLSKVFGGLPRGENEDGKGNN